MAERSPLADVDLSDTGDRVTLAEVPFLTQLDVRTSPSSSFPEPGTFRTDELDGEATFIWLGPDEWLVVGPPGAQKRLTERLESGRLESVSDTSVVDVSAQRTTLELRGPGALELLALGCSLDLHPRVFGPGRCAQTTLAHTPVILLQRKHCVTTGEPVFWVLVRASFASHLASWLLDASGDLTAGH
ncbi:sarcosine oxidase subunit gamma [Actinoplanes couchii]|uniref:Sarcosine oxidase subunit gamma n=1 Tax=Actinoplanes couchii TaxID=403638 RepID=A0ABQ3XMG6_9ACTN|nr:sarcosine oxidase subunit gamma family protein [Actinoplanes couchii]MDR6321564.1 sarcosine oxidase subunit gamma [Actinoplanes couchii]GID59660.1 sarcosine oxidase subunit gamma [Actinoplanes couchii]